MEHFRNIFSELNIYGVISTLAKCGNHPVSVQFISYLYFNFLYLFCFCLKSMRFPKYILLFNLIVIIKQSDRIYIKILIVISRVKDLAWDCSGRRLAHKVWGKSGLGCISQISPPTFARPFPQIYSRDFVQT